MSTVSHVGLDITWTQLAEHFSAARKSLSRPHIVQEGYDIDADITEEEKWRFAMEHAASLSVDFVTVPLLKPSTRGASNADELSFTVSDDCHADKIVPRVDIATENEEIFLAQISWIGHVNFHAVLFQLPAELTEIVKILPRICRFVNLALRQLRFTQIWISLPLVSSSAGQDPYLIWHSIKKASGNHPSLYAALSLGLSATSPDSTIEFMRWKGEPVSCLQLSEQAWIFNKSRYPVLPKALQTFVQLMVKFNVALIVPSCASEKAGKDAHVLYAKHLRDKAPALRTNEASALGYFDMLQTPLQPLMDNMDSNVYEVFMKDPVKYELYESAISKALVQRLALPSFERRLILMVVGAGGRGPLVMCAIRAAQALQCTNKLKIYALEKNPNAIRTLRRHSCTDPVWKLFERTSGCKIDIVAEDMRLWQPKDKADILVSELLGSFGDNELSPECLDGAQKYLRKAGETVLDANGNVVDFPAGVSIPASSTAFLAPMSSSKLHGRVQSLVKSSGENSWHVPYVVYAHSGFDEIVEPQPVWTFNHPSAADPSLVSNAHNKRYAQVEFKFPAHEEGAPLYVHGFAGYFEAVLYENGDDDRVLCSIHPKTHSPAMFSWFPMFFPFSEPVLATSGDVLRTSIWRCVDSDRKRVWYEWSAMLVRDERLLQCTDTFNKNGCGSWIGY